MRLSHFAVLLVAAAAAGQTPFDVPVEILAVDRNNPPVLYGTAPGRSINGLFRSADGGAQWSPLYILPAGGPQPTLTALEVHPSEPGTLFAATSLAQGRVWGPRIPALRGPASIGGSPPTARWNGFS
jgi:hypothetical protein